MPASSNFTLAQWQEAERGLRRHVVANQVQFSLAAPGPVDDLIPWAGANGRVVVAYSPLGQGVLAGRTTVPGPGGFGRPQARMASRRPGIEGLREAIDEVAAAHGATPAQVSLAWVLAHPNTVAIPGARTVEQLEENAAAADLELEDGEVGTADEGSESAGRPRVAAACRPPRLRASAAPCFRSAQRSYGRSQVTYVSPGGTSVGARPGTGDVRVWQRHVRWPGRTVGPRSGAGTGLAGAERAQALPGAERAQALVWSGAGTGLAGAERARALPGAERAQASAPALGARAPARQPRSWSGSARISAR